MDDGAPVILDPCFGVRSTEALCAVTATRMWRLKGVVLRDGGTVVTYGSSAGPAVPWHLLLDNGENCLLDWLVPSSIVKDSPRWICVLPKSLASARRVANPDGATLRVPAYGSPLRQFKLTDDPFNYTGAFDLPVKGTENDYIESLDEGAGAYWTARLQIGEDRTKLKTYRVVKATF